jgi:tight adherence protein B
MKLAIALIFVVVFAAILISIALAAQFLERQRREKVSGALKNIDDAPAKAGPTALLRRAGEGRSPLRELLSRLNFARSAEVWLEQSGVGWDLASLVTASVIAAAIGFVVGLRVRFGYPTGVTSVVFASLAGVLPFLFVAQRRKKRLAEFEQEFPEALDFLARALKAGHAFTSSLEMLIQESNEPLRSEFRRVHREQALGESVAVVLRHLADRVPVVDVRFFVSAVLMQRETGGNLGEILTKLAFVIRERFRLRGQVRAISAHGRITAAVLTLLPAVTVLALMASGPDYLKILLTERQGKYLIAGSIVGQISGYLLMRRIVDIKV